MPCWPMRMGRRAVGRNSWSLRSVPLYESKNRMGLDQFYNDVIVGMAKQEWYMYQLILTVKYQ